MEIKVKFTDDYIVGNGGLALAGHLIRKTDFIRNINQINLSEAPNPEIKHSDVAISFIGLLCQAKNDFDHIEAYRDDKFYKKAMRIDRVPSSATLRQRMDAADGEFRDVILEGNAKMIQKGAPCMTLCSTGHLVLDIDVSPFDNSNSKKEGVSWTYKKVDGYAPIFSYLGNEGYCVNLQLREGSTHCQYQTEIYLAETLRLAKKITSQKLLVRMDSGNDSGSNITVMNTDGTKADYIIKRNIRRESKITWLACAQEFGTLQKGSREGKRVWVGSLMERAKGCAYDSRMVYCVTERTMTAAGQILMVPEIEVDAWWTSLKDTTEADIIRLYKEHGTSEQFHSEFKTDMDLERLPSGKFKTNALVLELGMIAYNILRILGQESINTPGIPLRKKAKRRRLRTVIQNFITIAGKVVQHAGQLYFALSKRDKWAPPWKSIYETVSA